MLCLHKTFLGVVLVKEENTLSFCIKSVSIEAKLKTRVYVTDQILETLSLSKTLKLTLDNKP